MAIAPGMGIFNVAYFRNTIILTRGTPEDRPLDTSTFFFIGVNGTPFSTKNNRSAIQNILNRREIFHQPENNIHYHQRGTVIIAPVTENPCPRSARCVASLLSRAE